METTVKEVILTIVVYVLCFLTSPYSPIGMKGFIATQGLVLGFLLLLGIEEFFENFLSNIKIGIFFCFMLNIMGLMLGFPK